MTNTDGVVFWYRNYRGEEDYRHVRPISLRFGTSEYHPEQQWLLLGFDIEKQAEREFALKDARHLVGGGSIPFAAFTAGEQPTAKRGGGAMSIRQAAKSAANTPLEQWRPSWLKFETASLLDVPGYVMMRDHEKAAAGYPVTHEEMREFIQARRMADAMLENPDLIDANEIARMACKAFQPRLVGDPCVYPNCACKGPSEVADYVLSLIEAALTAGEQPTAIKNT